MRIQVLTKLSPHPGEIAKCELVAPSTEIANMKGKRQLAGRRLR